MGNSGITVNAGWHRLSCVCSECLAVDKQTIGPTDWAGWVTVSSYEFCDQPYWRKVYTKLKKDTV